MVSQEVIHSPRVAELLEFGMDSIATLPQSLTGLRFFSFADAARSSSKFIAANI